MKKIATSPFAGLLGVWDTQGQMSTAAGLIELKGVDSYELILDGYHLLHKANVTMGTEAGETHEIISLNPDLNQATM
jgi:hypothetical protein